MKVGDLVKWHCADNDMQNEFDVDYGIILSLSRSGVSSLHAQILFEDNTVDWLPCDSLEVFNEDW